MLDTKESWDSLDAPPRPRRRRRASEILANPLYRNISGRFVQSHDYIAMERLYELHSTGSYDLIVVDTPRATTPSTFSTLPSGWPTSSRAACCAG